MVLNNRKRTDHKRVWSRRWKQLERKLRGHQFSKLLLFAHGFFSFYILFKLRLFNQRNENFKDLQIYKVLNYEIIYNKVNNYKSAEVFQFLTESLFNIRRTLHRVMGQRISE